MQTCELSFVDTLPNAALSAMERCEMPHEATTAKPVCRQKFDAGMDAIACVGGETGKSSDR